MYKLPDPIDSSQQYLQYNHLDLPELTYEELKREERRVQYVLDFADRPSPWLHERLAAINRALAEHQSNPQPLPEQAADNRYQRRHVARVARFKRQLDADPYFSRPEHNGNGIPAAAIVHEGPSDG